MSRPPPSSVAAVLLVALGVVAAGVGVGVGVQQRQIAADWRTRAAAVEEQRDDARGRVDAYQRQLEEVAEALAVSETDVASLEDRVRQLADEKAQAEDVATTTGVERDTLVALSVSIASAVDALDGCVDLLAGSLNDAITAFNRRGAGDEVDVAPLNAARATAIAVCDTGRRDAASAVSRADELLR